MSLRIADAAEVGGGAEAAAQIEVWDRQHPKRKSAVAFEIVAIHGLVDCHTIAAVDEPGEGRRKVESIGSSTAPGTVVLIARVDAIQEAVGDGTGRASAHLLQIPPAATIEEVIRPGALRLLADDVDCPAKSLAPVQN